MVIKDSLRALSTRDILITLDIHCKHDWEKVLRIIITRKTDMLQDSNIYLKVEIKKYKLLYKGYKFVTLVDEEYPEKIAKLNKPSFVIYYKCNLEDLENKYFEKYKNVNDDIKRYKYGCFVD